MLAAVVIVSAAITNIDSAPAEEKIEKRAGAEISATPNLSFERDSFFTARVAPQIVAEVRKAPERNWSVLDPKVSAEAVIVQALDENWPLFYLNTYKSWPLASLTKLVTAVVVIESIGENKKIAIDEAAVATEGEAGNLKSGEVYTSRDLLKIMLLTSSNDAAAAFENHLGKEKFVQLMNEKLRELNMNQTVVYDASGLDDRNVSTASDILRLTKYILENEPQIFNWTRVVSQLVQPLNDVSSRTIININSLVNDPGFLGGKTGTSEKARQNAVAIFSSDRLKTVVVILGSRDRDREIAQLLEWAKVAYVFP